MRTHVDWITCTMPMVYGLDTPTAYADAIARGFLDMFGENIRREIFGGNWSKNEHGRAPYTDSWKLAETGISLFASPSLTHCCVEISGQGCERLIQNDSMEAVLGGCRERITRIDIATDIETNVTPLEFVSQTSHERMRTSGHYVSETGETCYVGSQKSDRFARVYRYAEPHPRSTLLRIEHVFRREQAKAVSRVVCDFGVEKAAEMSGNVFGWTHGIWQPLDTSGDKITVVSDSHKGGKTVFWLVDTVAPCFQRLCKEGIIKNPEEFIYRYFLSDT